MSWVEEEFAKINIGDKRLNNRLFSNNKCNIKNIFEPHKVQTAKRICKQKIILSIHDTSYMNYDSHKSTKGLGNIGGKSSKNESQNIEGLIFHEALAVTTTGIPLGMQSVKIWARDGEINEGWSESFSY